MQRIQNIFHWTVIGSVLSHIFCCGLPTIVSAISLLSGLGIIASMPAGLTTLHDILHIYELHLVVFSGVMIAFGWVLHDISRRIDCHDTGCGHPPCGPKKKRSTKLLIFASGLFLMNIVVYFGFDHAVPVAELYTGHIH